MTLFNVFSMAIEEARYQYSLVNLLHEDAGIARLVHMFKYSEILDELTDLQTELLYKNAFSKLPVSPFQDRNPTEDDFSRMNSDILQNYHLKQAILRQNGMYRGTQLLEEEEAFIVTLNLMKERLGKFWILGDPSTRGSDR